MSNRQDSAITKTTKNNPCLHCGKPDWCYSLGDNLSVCNRDSEPHSDWYRTSKMDSNGHYIYAKKNQDDKDYKKYDKPVGITYYEYSDRNGRVFVRAVKTTFENGKKKFHQESWQKLYSNRNKRGWKNGLGDIKTDDIPIYRYREIKEAIALGKTIFIVEGEKCADAMWGLGLAATCNIGGAGCWRAKHTEDLAGAKEIILVPDRDKPGVEHMEKIALDFPNAKWLYCGHSQELWDSPPLAHGTDIADYILGDRVDAEKILSWITTERKIIDFNVKSKPKEARKQEKTLLNKDEIITKINEMIFSDMSDVDQEFFWHDLSKASGMREDKLKKIATMLRDEEPLICMSAKEFANMELPSTGWLVDGFLTGGTLNLLVAESKVGKSLLHYDLCHALASGKNWGHFEIKEPSKVLICQSDEAKSDTQERVIVRGLNLLPNVDIMSNFHAGRLGALKDMIIERNSKFVVIDSLISVSSRLAAKMNEVEFGFVMYGFKKVCEETGATILLIHHTNKGGEKDTLGSVAGSFGIAAGATSIFSLGYPEGQINTQRVLKTLGSRAVANGSAWLLNLNIEDNSFEFFGSCDFKGKIIKEFEDLEKEANYKNLVYDYLKGCNYSRTAVEISTGLGIPEATVRHIAKSLTIHRPSEIKRVREAGNKPFYYFFNHKEQLSNVAIAHSGDEILKVVATLDNKEFECNQATNEQKTENLFSESHGQKDHLPESIDNRSSERGDRQVIEEVIDECKPSEIDNDILSCCIGTPISFKLTLPQLLSGKKTVTRRVWKDSHAKKFIKAFNDGKFIPAYDKDQRNGGKLVGYLVLECEPYKECINNMVESDVINEGFPELTLDEFKERFFKEQVINDEDVWVIRFEFVINQ